MIKFFSGILLATVLLSALVQFGVRSNEEPPFDKMMESVVFIKAVDKDGQELGHGSGVVIQDGTIVSANHVFQTPAAKYEISTKKGKEVFTAEIIKAYPETDLIHLKTKEVSNIPRAKVYCGEVKVGQRIISMGNPTFLKYITTFGRIAGVNVALDQGTGRDYKVTITDLNMAPGMSGGPVFDVTGLIVGLNDAMLTYATGINLTPVDPDDQAKGAKIAPTTTLLGISMIVPATTICEKLDLN